MTVLIDTDNISNNIKDLHIKLYKPTSSFPKNTFTNITSEYVRTLKDKLDKRIGDEVFNHSFYERTSCFKYFIVVKLKKKHINENLNHR